MLYEYECPNCKKAEDRYASIAARDEQTCDCGTKLARIEIPSSQVTRSDALYSFGLKLTNGQVIKGALGGPYKQRKGFGA